MTYASPLSCSVLMSKFMAVSPRKSVRPLGGPLAEESIQAARAATALLRLLGSRLRGRRERLDQALDLALLRRGRVEREVLLQRGDLDLVLALRLRRLGDVVLRLRILRPQLRRLLVALERRAVLGARLLAVLRQERVRLLRVQLLERVRGQRLPERAGREDRLPRVRGLLGRLRPLVARGELRAERE